mmetsp:Transcript_23457/g.50870  ORF Transcript_23457/g.50870 Transcript_23457/m.50870 type:complete len:180 (+) Transcript_23457:126-665(+)
MIATRTTAARSAAAAALIRGTAGIARTTSCRYPTCTIVNEVNAPYRGGGVVRCRYLASASIPDAVEVTRTESAGNGSIGSSIGSGGTTPIGNAGGADANRPSITTESSTCSHGISTDPNLLDKEAAAGDEEDDMEDMFVEPDVCLGTTEVEWGGPRRGGRFAEPTRFGDWERKGRCSDF